MTRILTATLLTLLTAQAQASVTLYTDETAYLAAVGATRTFLDFNAGATGSVSGAAFSPDVTFGSCTDNTAPGTCSSSVLHNSGGITDLGGSAEPNGVASVAWRFNLPDVQAFAFHYVSGAIDSIALVATSLALDIVDTSAASGFIGLVSDSNFYGAIGVNAKFGGGIGNDRYFVDDFRISDKGAAVPEPASLALAALGLAAAGLARRHRPPAGS